MLMMSRAELAADLKASLQDAADVFNAPDGADFVRFLDKAALDFYRVRSRTLLGELTLVADQFAYDAPADMLAYKSALWGAERRIQPWEKHYPGRLPDVYLSEESGERKLHFLPAPTAQQIAVLGSTFKYWYFAAHQIGEDAADTTILSGQRGLLLLRAQAEAMREMAMRNIAKPVSMRDGVSNGPRNGTPAALYAALMQEFEEAAR
jgi:hypothetical protein